MYRFRFLAQNQIGLESDFSTIQFMRAGQLPSMPGPLQLVLQNNELIHFKWKEPFDNGGSEVQDYDVLITRVTDSTQTMINVVNTREFQYTPADGLMAGFEYSI